MATLLEYSPLLSAVASILMLVVWGVYLDLFWRSYRRQHRAKIIIGQGEGMGLDSLCLVSNMGAEHVHIEGVIVAAERGEHRWARAVTSFSDIQGGGPKKPSREGPLKSGEYFVLGTFRELLDLANGPPADAADWGGPLDAIAIWIVADLASERDLVFASRRFLIFRCDRATIFRPEGLETRRIARARERREIEEVLQRHLEEATGGPAPSRAIDGAAAGC